MKRLNEEILFILWIITIILALSDVDIITTCILYILLLFLIILGEEYE